jgi:hypothetical protein
MLYYKMVDKKAFSYVKTSSPEDFSLSKLTLQYL